MSAAAQADMGQHPLRVLLVEDDEDDYLCTRDLLRDIGEGRFALDWVTKFEDAVAVMARQTHDVYLVDYCLGSHDGLELLNEANQRSAPVILLTGLDDRDVDLRAMQAGATDYLVKGRIDAALLERSIRYSIQRKQMEEELRRYAEALRQADHHKDEFLAMLAHELGNQLHPIRNAVEILKQEGTSATAFVWATDLIDRQSSQLALLVNDLFDVASIVHGKLKLRKESVELGRVIAQSVEASRANIDARKQELTVSLPPKPVRLNADPARLVQVWTNLLNNAAKYTEEGGRIWITAEVLEGQVVVRVRDTGIGILQEKLLSIFELFTQLEDSQDRSQGGLGLGLTIVGRLVKAHGGTVHALSDGLGKGSEFVTRLPILPESSLRPGVGPKASSLDESVCRRILFVDDNVDLAESWGLLMTRHGHKVQVVHDGPTAIAATMTFQPEFVFMDISLPGMNGYDVARKLRNQPGLENLRLVAVSGHGDDNDRCLAHQAGFDEYLVKPFGFDVLQKLVARGQSRSRRINYDRLKSNEPSS
ncbi:MAG: hybrid sensor histidine kinase/response regulator [Pirellulaceae bacterium]|nr:hybrid sensor histidine kinase/response regulator [Pirellulaceae bacterium]